MIVCKFKTSAVNLVHYISDIIFSLSPCLEDGTGDTSGFLHLSKEVFDKVVEFTGAALMLSPSALEVPLYRLFLAYGNYERNVISIGLGVNKHSSVSDV